MRRLEGKLQLRLRLVTTFIALMIVLSVVPNIIGHNLWPFGYYDMFSETRDEYAVEVPRLYGVPTTGLPNEMALLDEHFIAPFDNVRLSAIFWRESFEPNRLAAVLTSILQRYEQRRVAGDHLGPALQELRLYRLRWADSRTGDPDQPDSRELVVAVSSSIGQD